MLRLRLYHLFPLLYILVFVSATQRNVTRSVRKDDRDILLDRQSTPRRHSVGAQVAAASPEGRHDATAQSWGDKAPDRKKNNNRGLWSGHGTEATSCQSVLLLSPGRTATDTVSSTIVKSTPLSYCHRKETFKAGAYPTVKKLQSCFKSNKRGAYVHVKPEHILLRNENINSSKYLTTPEHFFRAAEEAGFSLVVTSFRDNQLARLVSSFEMHPGKFGSVEFLSKANGSFVHTDLIRKFEQLVQDYNRGVASARAVKGLSMMHITFSEIIGDVCGTSRRIATAAHCPVFTCKEDDGHMDKSHRERDLAGRIGDEAAASVTKQLKGTPYEWMLDLHATSWPKKVPRPVPVAM